MNVSKMFKMTNHKRMYTIPPQTRTKRTARMMAKMMLSGRHIENERGGRVSGSQRTMVVARTMAVECHVTIFWP